MNLRTSCVALAALLLATAAHSAGFNVDFGSGAGIPDASHGGPAGQPGHWNVLTGLEPEPVELFDLDAAPAQVTVSLSLPFGPAQSDHPATAGGEGALLDDYLDLHSVPATLEIRGLPKGTWEITVVTWAPDLPGARTSVGRERGRSVLVGGEWPGGYAAGVTHSVHRQHVRAGDVVSLRLFGIGRGTLNGLQLRSRPR